MADQDGLWYRIGYGLEHARGAVPGGLRLRSLAERRADKVTPRRPARPAAAAAVGTASPPSGDAGEADDASRDGHDALLAALAAALGSKVLHLAPVRRRPGLGRLVKAGAAGAGAAVLREVLRPLVTARADGRPLQEAVADAAVAGSARGLLYGALIEPRLPGPSLLRGLLFGYAEYLASPWGGLTKLAGQSAPHRSVPVLAGLFDDLGPHEDTLADHLAFSVTLALLYGGGAGRHEEEEHEDPQQGAEGDR